MTKKTNSLLFRLGINSLWRLKLTNFNSVFCNLRLDQMFKSELLKHKWSILSIKWSSHFVNLQVYSALNPSKYFNRDIFEYLKEVKSVKKLCEKFSVNFRFVINILTALRIKKTLKTKKYLMTYYRVIILFRKKLKLKLFLMSISRLSYFNWIELHLILDIFLKKRWLKQIYKKHFISYFYLTEKLRTLNGVVYFKTLSINFENILFNITKKIIKIEINNIWKNIGWFQKKIFKKKKNFILQVLFLSCYYHKAELFSEYIALYLRKQKNHRKLLRQITLTIEGFWKRKKFGLKGIQLRVSGKLNGKMRKSKYHYNIGKVQVQTLFTTLDYYLAISYTKFGIISTKFWILYGNTKI